MSSFMVILIDIDDCPNDLFILVSSQGGKENEESEFAIWEQGDIKPLVEF